MSLPSTNWAKLQYRTGLLAFWSSHRLSISKTIFSKPNCNGFSLEPSRLSSRSINVSFDMSFGAVVEFIGFVFVDGWRCGFSPPQNVVVSSVIVLSWIAHNKSWPKTELISSSNELPGWKGSVASLDFSSSSGESMWPRQSDSRSWMEKVNSVQCDITKREVCKWANIYLNNFRRIDMWIDRWIFVENFRCNTALLITQYGQNIARFNSHIVLRNWLLLRE